MWWINSIIKKLCVSCWTAYIFASNELLVLLKWFITHKIQTLNVRSTRLLSLFKRAFDIKDLRFLQHRWRGFSPCEMLSCAAGQEGTKYPKEGSAFTSKSSGVLEGEGNRFLRNVGISTPLHSFQTARWKFHEMGTIIYITVYYKVCNNITYVCVL